MSGFKKTWHTLHYTFALPKNRWRANDTRTRLACLIDNYDNTKIRYVCAKRFRSPHPVIGRDLYISHTRHNCEITHTLAKYVCHFSAAAAAASTRARIAQKPNKQMAVY